MDINYYNKYLKYKKKYLDLKVKQAGGAQGQVQAPATLDEDIANYTMMAQFNSAANETLNLLNAIRECNSIINLTMLASRSDNASIRRHIREKINILDVGGEGSCNTIAENGDVVNLNQSASVNVVLEESSYNPNRNSNGVVLPAQMPVTQSGFYMPLISEAYYIASGQAVPQFILNQSGMVTGLPGISAARYNNMVQSLVNYLQIDGNLARLQAQYAEPGETQPSDNNDGHISGPNQEALLGAVNLGEMSLQLILEQAIGLQYVGR